MKWLPLSLMVMAMASPASTPKKWSENFNLASCEWSATGRNDYFVLEPGYQELLDGHSGKDAVHLEIIVTDEIRKINGVDTRVVEERESRAGQMVEISRNFFAICKTTNDVFYFGEDVDMYKDGKIVSHEGSWTAGRDAKPGLFMPARPLLGSRFYQELAPKVAMDRSEIISDSETLNTPAGEFRDCVKTEETTPLEPGAREVKVFARGVGLVQDGELFLSKFGKVAR